MSTREDDGLGYTIGERMRSVIQRHGQPRPYGVIEMRDPFPDGPPEPPLTPPGDPDELHRLTQEQIAYDPQVPTPSTATAGATTYVTEPVPTQHAVIAERLANAGAKLAPLFGWTRKPWAELSQYERALLIATVREALP